MRFEELFRILTSDRILRPVCSAYPDMSADWNALPEPARKAEQMARYGLDMELVWYVLEAAQEMNMPLQSVIPWAEKIAGNVMRKGITPAGEVALYGYLDKPMAQVDHLYWWAQSEATAMLVKLYELTGKEEYWTCLGRVMRCSAAKMESPSGVWYSEVDQKTGLRNDQGGYGWKAGMHVIRAMIVAENSLAKIQK